MALEPRSDKVFAEEPLASPTVQTGTATDAPTGERLLAIDIARGLALLGVGVVNVLAFAQVWSSVHALDLAHTAVDVVAEYAVAMLFIHRCYPLLAFLFGVGLAWQWQQLAEPRKVRRLRPRLWALLLIGVCHGLLLWPGDVRSTYAIVGLCVVALAGASAQRLRRWTIAAYVLAAIFYGAAGAMMWLWAGPPSLLPEVPSSFAQSTLRVALAMHPGEFLERGLAQTLAPDLWAHVLFGMWAARSGALVAFLRPVPTADTRSRQPWHVAGATLLAGGSILEIIAAGHGGWAARSNHDLGLALMTLAAVPVSVGAIWAWLALATHLARAQPSLLRTLAIASGRAPLTQFIGQSLLFALLFNDSLIGWHGEVGRATCVAIALLVWQVLSAGIARWFARGHRHGPLEVVWRGLTRRLTRA